MSGGGERLRAAAERYPNPSTDWRILAKLLSGAFGLGRRYGTRGCALSLAKNAALLGIADLLRDVVSKRHSGKMLRRFRQRRNIVYVISFCPIISYNAARHLKIITVNP